MSKGDFGVIYKVTNLINNKVYIGQTTKDLNERMLKHLQDAKYENKTIFHRAINKYGNESFK